MNARKTTVDVTKRAVTRMARSLAPAGRVGCYRPTTKHATVGSGVRCQDDNFLFTSSKVIGMNSSFKSRFLSPPPIPTHVYSACVFHRLRLRIILIIDMSVYHINIVQWFDVHKLFRGRGNRQHIEICR